MRRFLDELKSLMQLAKSVFAIGDEELSNSYSKLFMWKFDWKMIHQSVTNPSPFFESTFACWVDTYSLKTHLNYKMWSRQLPLWGQRRPLNSEQLLRIRSVKFV